MSAKYDFRDGMLLEKVVYKDESIDIKSRILYILCIIITWCWGCAWFALFFYAYIFHEQITFWIFVIAICIHALIIIILGARTLIASNNKKIEKRNKLLEAQKQEKEIEENKRKRAHILKEEQLQNYHDDDDNKINTGVNNHNDLIEKISNNSHEMHSTEKQPLTPS